MATVKVWATGDPVDAADLNENFSKIIATETFTAGETLANNDSVYFNSSDNRVYKADADTASHVNAWVGFATASATAGNSIEVQTVGRKTGFAGLTSGSVYFVSGTAGNISTTAGTNVREVGMAVSTTDLFIFTRASVQTISFETTIGSTHSLTTVAGERVMVFAKASVAAGGPATHVLTYNGVTKDSVTTQIGSGGRSPLAFMYTEIPGAATADIVCGGDSEQVIMVIKIRQS